ncbi:MAG: TonB-dependent receptor [Bacteroidota bacterium]
MKKTILSLVYVCLSCALFSQQKYSLSGTMKDASNGEELIGATLYVEELETGAVTNVYGYYSISLPAGSYNCIARFVGYENVKFQIDLQEDIRKDIELSLESTTLDLVEITAEKQDQNVDDVQMSVEKLSAIEIKAIPALMGEVDLIKAIQLLPGVQTIGEGTSGMYVRGGNHDQNLVLLDESIVYNASHMLGIFSVFNTDAIKDVQLYKGGIPATYGGRLSSVLDIRMNEGNDKRFEATGGIGTISSRATLETPFMKNKGSFMIAGRRTYADIFLGLSSNPDLNENQLYFYDLNAKANLEIDPNNRVFASGYFGRDVFRFGTGADAFGLDWGNATGTIRWNHIYGPKLFSNLTLLRSNYDYFLGQDEGVDAFKWTSNIKDLSLKLDYTYFLNPNNTIEFGYQGIHHRFEPGTVSSDDPQSIVTGFKLDDETAYEHGLYVSNEQKVGKKLTMEYGLRFSLFQNIGEAREFVHDSNYEIVDTLFFEKGDVYNTYSGLEPRLGARYKLNSSTSIKASYNRMNQYIQLASNSTSATPFDIWFPASPEVKPQTTDQVALGYFKNLKDNLYETSVEVYYKKNNNVIDFRDHAQLFLQEDLEGELRTGTGQAYGLELLLRKKKGLLKGFVSYTLSRTEKTIDGINGGETYRANYDKTHDFAVVGNYFLNERMTLGFNWVFQSGRAVTMPTGRFFYLGQVIPVYSDRNAERLPNYHRLDLSLTLQQKKNSERKWKGEWVFSLYNAYNRHNTFSINFRQEEDNPEVTYAEKTYLFGIIPSVTYNFKF